MDCVLFDKNFINVRFVCFFNENTYFITKTDSSGYF